MSNNHATPAGNAAPPASSPAFARDPMARLLILVLFTTPFASGSPLFILATVLFLLAFIILAHRGTLLPALLLPAELRRHHPALFYALALFIMSSAISCMLEINRADSSRHIAAASVQYAFYALMLGYAFSLARMIQMGKIRISQLFGAYAAGCVILAMLLMIRYLSGHAGNENWAMHAPFGEHARIMGIIASIATITCINQLLFSPPAGKRQLTILAAAGLLVCSTFLVWTGSRTSMAVTLLVTLVLSGWLLATRAGKHKRIALVAVILALAIPLSKPFSVFYWSGIQRMIAVSGEAGSGNPSVSTFKAEDAASDRLTSGRATQWKLAWAGIQLKPWFGYGPNGYFFSSMRYKNLIHPHNAILQFLVEWGFMGTGFLLAFLAMLAWEGLKHLPAAIRHHDSEYVLAASVAMVLGLTSMTDGIFFITQGLFTITTALAVFPFLRKTGAG